jgi:hypothetical protein
MKKYRHIFLELILIFSAVLVFRSLWTIMDSIELLNETYVHIILLIVGILLSIFAVNKLNQPNSKSLEK